MKYTSTNNQKNKCVKSDNSEPTPTFHCMQITAQHVLLKRILCYNSAEKYTNSLCCALHLYYCTLHYFAPEAITFTGLQGQQFTPCFLDIAQMPQRLQYICRAVQIQGVFLLVPPISVPKRKPKNSQSQLLFQ